LEAFHAARLGRTPHSSNGGRPSPRIRLQIHVGIPVRGRGESRSRPPCRRRTTAARASLSASHGGPSTPRPGPGPSESCSASCQRPSAASRSGSPQWLLPSRAPWKPSWRPLEIRWFQLCCARHAACHGRSSHFSGSSWLEQIIHESRSMAPARITDDRQRRDPRPVHATRSAIHVTVTREENSIDFIR
jgi:hypothetical protein